ncbi:MAG: squalene synthase HpnC [Betaproteobacteria bacterium HGW-Betaproteobacteria-8]|nr:MAG: squalene synthase HpnC [Betaproteobacteria bacterium HGW-Betaproteobacteria-8]
MSTQHSQALALAQTHYENFPVASALLPMRLRQPIGMIYSFARQADDFADEGDLLPDERLALLDGFRQELDRIHDKTGPEIAFFVSLQDTINQHQLPLQPFYDLLDAFSQDVTKSRYADFGEVMDYCRRSANPIGRLLLHLYGKATPRNIGMSDAICSSLQIINFLQDVAIDYKKDRIYFPQDEMRKYRIDESQIADGRTDGTWRLFMEFEIKRARNLLQAGAPLGLVLPGRIGLEMRTIIAGGERILQKLHKSRGDMFNQRPVLKPWDWAYMLFRAVSKR